MREFSFRTILGDLGVFPVGREVETESDLECFLQEHGQVSPAALEAIRAGMADQVFEPVKFRLKPKMHVDFNAGLVWPVPWKVYTRTSGLTDCFIPLGLSIGLRSSDGKTIALQRSTKNRACKGFLGTPAGYMVLSYEDFESRKMAKTINLDGEVRKNVYDQLFHELGLKPEEYSWWVAGVVSVDYPERQDELLVMVEADLTADEILKRAAENKGTETGVPENKVMVLTADDLESLMAQNIPAASQHLAALCYTAGADWEMIHDMDRPDPSLPFEIDISTMI